VAVVTGDDPDSGGREALSNAALTAGEELTAQIAETWFSKGVGSSKIEVHVEGISGHIADFVKFRGAMGVMSGVDSVQRKEMQADTAVLLVDYQGSARALVDALMRQSFDTFGLNIAEPQGNTIRLQIVPR
jgi:3-deoxy-D-arabino-heptulosonate 7-phosphate (DAHP) synthase class II